jgi:hypothetical protein
MTKQRFRREHLQKHVPSFGELDLIATLWAGTTDAIKMVDPKNFADKIVIDVTNPHTQDGMGSL